MELAAPSLVLLRGLVREQRHWEQFPHFLRKMLSPCLVATPDIAGNGSRFEQISASSITAMVEDLRQQVELTPPYTLVAISMGGMIATQWAKLYPDEVQALILINTSFSNFSPLYQRLKVRWFPAIIKTLLVPGKFKARERLILKMTTNHYRCDNKLSQRWSEYAREFPVSSANMLRQLKAAACFSSPSQSPCVRTLLICGLSDQLVDPRCSKAIAANWQVPLIAHPGAGHDLPLDEPLWLAQTIARFLADDGAALKVGG